MNARRALTILLTLLLTACGVCQERFANGNPVQDGRGGVFYATGEPARMASGRVQYRNAGFGFAAIQGGAAYYPSGRLMRQADGTLFYQSGQVARQNGAVYHQNGSLAFDASGGRYANGAPTGGSVTLREPFPGGNMAIVVRRGVAVGYLFISLGDGWSLVVNLDSGEWEVAQ